MTQIDPASPVEQTDLPAERQSKVPTGFTLRPARLDQDIEAITDLCNAASVAEYGTGEATAQMVRESYSEPGFDPVTDTLLVLDPSGAIAAVGEFYDSDGHHVAPFVYLRVRPDAVDVGAGVPLMVWVEDRGRRSAELAPPDARVALHSFTAAVNLPMQALFERSGWRLDRHEWTMEIDLGDDPPDAPQWPEGITVRTALEGRDEPAIHAASNDAFSDHFGFLPESYERWLHFATKVLTYEPDRWYVAMDGDEIAGVCLCLPEGPGRPEIGWVDALGVRRLWRRRGLGLALLRHAFRDFHRRGMRRVGLGVDAQSLTGATRLYERAGMHVVQEHRKYELELRPGRELRTTVLPAVDS